MGSEDHCEQASMVSVCGRGDSRGQRGRVRIGVSRGEALWPGVGAREPDQAAAPAPLGMEVFFEDVKPPSPASVRLGRWLFYDTRLSADNTLACASCHKPEYAFSEPTPVSTGIKGQKGTRKAPTFINKAVTLAPHFFWDGRAHSLEDQVLGPIANPIEMGNTHEAMIDTLSRVQGYKPYFTEAFGSDASPRSESRRPSPTTSARASAATHPTTGGGSITSRRGDSRRQTRARSLLRHRRLRVVSYRQQLQRQPVPQPGRGLGSSEEDIHGRRPLRGHEEAGGPRAFKTPVLRDVSKHAPYMHDGSIATLREVVELYNKGGIANPYLTRGRIKPLGLKDEDVDAIVAFLQSLDGQGYQDTPPTTFPQ
jgi:cytochrome c peroxidase